MLNKLLNKLKRFARTFAYACRKQWWLIAIVALVMLVCVYCFWNHCPSATLLMVWWNNYWNAAADLITLLVALVLWWNDVERQRRETLPKWLDVDFTADVHTGQVVLRCQNARISAASDERAFAQQIGMQMCGMTQLPMETAGIHFEYLGLQGEGNNERQQYFIRIPLRMHDLRERLPKDSLDRLGQWWVVNLNGNIDKSKRLPHQYQHEQ